MMYDTGGELLLLHIRAWHEAGQKTDHAATSWEKQTISAWLFKMCAFHLEQESCNSCSKLFKHERFELVTDIS